MVSAVALIVAVSGREFSMHNQIFQLGKYSLLNALPSVLPKTISRTLGAALLLTGSIISTQAAADGSRLQSFVQDTTTFMAGFEQTLFDADSTPLQVSTGTIQLKRPGRFVWQYVTPNKQQLVSDGKQLWLFDQDLEQVTVNALEDKVGGTPLVLLMGTRPLDEEFTVKVMGEAEGIEWYELIPRTTRADFEALFVGLNNQGLAAMELRDNFGQATQIVFSNMKPGVPIDDSVFVFNVPAGVDVIGQ